MMIIGMITYLLLNRLKYYILKYLFLNLTIGYCPHKGNFTRYLEVCNSDDVHCVDRDWLDFVT